MKTVSTLMILAWTQWIAVLIFMYGFLPIKQPLPGLATVDQDVPDWAQREWLRRKVGQVVLVVIDALRADFVLPKSILAEVGMAENEQRIDFLSKLVTENEQELVVNALVARANAPTVTMPRIKALMTGSIPGFVDVVLNFGSKKLEGDSLIEQWKLNGLNLTMFGDDTWLKLFPDHFMREDGTTSFFVSDFTEVDDNVTRHLEVEIEMRRDWDISILHFLGLDHIGHLDGPQGSAVRPKLHEMGEIVRYLTHELILNKTRWKHPDLPPIVVVLGDHGMADAGGHGGSSTSEIMTPMVFLTHAELSLTKKSVVCKQADLVPTLAWLTGVPIPRNNLGSILFHESGKDGLMYNAHQIAKCSGHAIHEVQMENVQVKIQEMVEVMEETAAEYNLTFMLVGITLSLLCCYVLVTDDPYRAMTSVTLWRHLHILSLGSTSFIEEEHQTIYFMTSTIFVAHLLASFGMNKAKVLNACAALAILRVARAFNQTGDKWSHWPDFGDWLKKSNHLPFLVGTHLIGLAILGAISLRNLQKSRVSQLLSIISLSLVLLQKVSELNSQRVVWPARLVYLMSIVIMKSHTVTGVSHILAVLFSAHNTLLLTLHLILERLVDFDRPETVDLHSFLGWTLFFQLGNSNGLATIDVGAAYAGISSYHHVVVGTMLALSTFGGPILWSVMLSKSYFRDDEAAAHSFAPILLSRGIEVSLYLIVTTIERHHLFVWTVFSPKLLYLFMAVLVLNIVYSITLILVPKKRQK